MAHQSPNCRNENNIQQQNVIGKVFARYSEQYISEYKPSLPQIKLIRNIRKCRTPAMGSILIRCKACGASIRIYKSCGDSKCPICQGPKRLQAQDKISAKMLAVPYVHATFTLPHDLNMLIRQNKKLLYGLLHQAAWKTIKTLSADPKNIGALPGMITIIHTWGSDMKYHVHLHTLITFGGLDQNQNWIYPKRKKKIAPFRKINRLFRDNYIDGIQKLRKKKKLIEVPKLDNILSELKTKNWCVNNTNPQIDTKVLEEYLSRYILKIAISNSRLSFDQIKQQVHIIYNDYRNQKDGEPAPKKVKSLDPLNFIHQFLQHVPPARFNRVRYYGLHHPNTFKKIESHIPDELKRNSKTVRTLIQIICDILKQEIIACTQCGGSDFETKTEPPDYSYLEKNIPGYKKRAPPTKHTYQKTKNPDQSLTEKGELMPISQQNQAIQGQLF